MASLLKTGNYSAIAITFTAAAPATLYDPAVDQDLGACTAYKITNTDTTNWLWINIAKMHHTLEGTPVMPGETVTFVRGANEILKMTAWVTAPNVACTGTAAAGSVAGGFQKKV